MLPVSGLLAVVLWTGFYSPQECRERIEQAVTSKTLRWMMEIPTAPVPPSCRYLLKPEELKTLNED